MEEGGSQKHWATNVTNRKKNYQLVVVGKRLAHYALIRIFHESRPGVTPTADMAMLPGVLGPPFGKLRTSAPCGVLSSTPRVRVSRGSAGLPGGTPIFTVLRRQFLKYPG